MHVTRRTIERSISRFSIQCLHNIWSISSQLCSLNKKNCKRSASTFGIVAALTNDGVIGLDGSLPWKHLPKDREYFENLTRNRILIMGRKTFIEEDPTGRHVCHARVCIVLSKSLNYITDIDENHVTGPEVIFSRSFQEALNVANHLSQTSAVACSHNYASLEKNAYDEEAIDCWVVGGEQVYKEAIKHTGALEVHLTHVDMTVNDDYDSFLRSHIAYFPLNDLKRYGFEEVKKIRNGKCTFCVYRKGKNIDDS